MKRKNSLPFETNSSGGKGSVGRPNNSQLGLATPQRKRDGSGLNKSLIVQSSAQSQAQLASVKPVLKKKKAVIVTKRVVKKKVHSGVAAQAANAASLSAQATPDRRTHMTTRSGGLTKTQSSEGRVPKSPSSQFKSSAARAHNKNNSSLLSFSSEPGALKNQRQASVPMLRKENPKAISKKRVGTPIKLKHSYLKDEANASYLEDLNKEIRELREKRMQHNTFNQRINDEAEDDDFETAIFAETLLGELGSS